MPVSVAMSVAVAVFIALSVIIPASIASFERLKLLRVLPKSATASLLFFFVLPHFNPPLQTLYPLVNAGGRWFAEAYFHASLRGVVKRILWNKDHRCGIFVLRDLNLALFPHFH
jgi:hypothetical protein